MMQRRRCRSVSPSPARDCINEQKQQPAEPIKLSCSSAPNSVSPSLPWSALRVGDDSMQQSTRNNSASPHFFDEMFGEHQQQQERGNSLSMSPKALSVRNNDDDDYDDASRQQEMNEEQQQLRESIYPLNQLCNQFSHVEFIAEGGYARVFSATDLALTAATGADGPALRVAVKTMSFVCAADDARRLESLAQYGDIAQLLAGQEYVPPHIGAELLAHAALRGVEGTMPLLRVSVWVAPSDDDTAPHRCCWVMLSLPLLRSLHSRSFASPSSGPRLLPAVAQIATTLQKMHERNWLHRDLSVTNVFSTSFAAASASSSAASSATIIGDFGLAACVSGRCNSATHYATSASNACTTIWYRSPEIISDPDNIAYSFEQDAWALGVVACELALGVPVFPGLTREEQREHMKTFFADGSAATMLLMAPERDLCAVRTQIVRCALEFLLLQDPAKRSVAKFIASLKA